MNRKLGIYFLVGAVIPLVLVVVSSNSSIDGALAVVARTLFIVSCPGYILSVLLLDLESSHWFDIGVGSILNGLTYVGLVVLFARMPREPAWYRPVAISGGAAVWFGGLFLFS